MSNKVIKISIITPAHNEALHIAECIESVLNQTYTNFEMVVADDASTDGTADIVEDFSKSDKRIKLVRLPENGGAAAARNAALDVVEGDYILFLDADDWILPTMFSDLVEQIRRFNRAVMFRLKSREVSNRGVFPAPTDSYETYLSTPEDLLRENKMGGG